MKGLKCRDGEIFVQKIIKINKQTSSMKKKIAKKRAAALDNVQNIRENQKQEYVSKCIRIRRSRREEQKTQASSAKKKIQQPENEFAAIFKILLKLKFRKNVKKQQKNRHIKINYKYISTLFIVPTLKLNILL